MAARGIATTGGVIDAGYRGEILVLMTNLGGTAVELKAGEKIAQMVPVPVLTGAVEEAEDWEPRRGRGRGLEARGNREPGVATWTRERRSAPGTNRRSVPYHESRTMKFIEAFKLALQSLWANKMRTILTLIGVVMGVASVIMVITLVNGANMYVANKLSATAPMCLPYRAWRA